MIYLGSVCKVCYKQHKKQDSYEVQEANTPTLIYVFIDWQAVMQTRPMSR
jgi:hypothetical protein